MALLETSAAVVTAIAASIAAYAAFRGYRRLITHEKPVLDFSITRYLQTDNVLEARLEVHNHARTKIVVRGIRLLKPTFPDSGIPQVGLSSDKNLGIKVLLPQKELQEPFEVEPRADGRMNFLFYLYQRPGELVDVELGVDIEYIGTEIETETIKIKREITMPPPRES